MSLEICYHTPNYSEISTYITLLQNMSYSLILTAIPSILINRVEDISNVHTRPLKKEKYCYLVSENTTSILAVLTKLHDMKTPFKNKYH